MAPGNKRKGKAIAVESSTSADNRFCNEKAAVNYTMLMTKSMPRERGFDLEYPKRPLIVQAVNRHWRDFIKTPSNAVIPVVREFYANLREGHVSCEVTVRDKNVYFHSNAINRLYNMPNIDEDGYTAFKKPPVDFDELINFLCYPGAVWKLNVHNQVINFKSRFLKKAAAAVFLFVNARLMPTKHETDVTKDRAILMYCILKGFTINVGRIIEDSILQAATATRNISLPHPSLITELCQSAGVVWDKEEEILPPKVDIKVPNRQTMESDHEPTARASGSTSQQDTSPTPPLRQPTVHQRMDALEHKVDNLYQNTANFMTYMVDFNTALAQRFPDPNNLYQQFPEPPEWADDGNEEDEDEDDEH